MAGNRQGAKALDILVVDDSEDDVILTREGFAATGLPVNIHHVIGGYEALAYLRKVGRYANAITPDLVMLDLNMPGMGGREVMRHIDEDPELRHFPVILLSSSDEPRDVMDLYKLRCSAYVVKPVEFEQFVHAIRRIVDFYANIARLPTRP